VSDPRRRCRCTQLTRSPPLLTLMTLALTNRFEIPRVTAMVRHAVPRLIEGTAIPFVLFVVVLDAFGLTSAVVAGLAWSYGAVVRRVVTRRAVPGVIVLGAAAITVKSAIMLGTGSTLVYFLQPALGTAVVGAAFLISVPLGAPLAGRLARDFCPIPDDVLNHHHMRRFFVQISLLWAVAQLAAAAVGSWIVFTQSTAVIALARPMASWGITAAAIAASTGWFFWSMRRHGLLTFPNGREPCR
jgi:hypothetical protein